VISPFKNVCREQERIYIWRHLQMVRSRLSIAFFLKIDILGKRYISQISFSHSIVWTNVHSLVSSSCENTLECPGFFPLVKYKEVPSEMMSNIERTPFPISHKLFMIKFCETRLLMSAEL
jgi:hypothetical protein